MTEPSSRLNPARRRGVHVFVSPWVYVLGACCGVFVAFGVVYLVLHQDVASIVIGVFLLVSSSWAITSYARVNTWVVVKDSVWADRQRIRLGDVQCVGVAEAAAASPVGGWVLVLSTPKGPVAGVATLTQWGGRRKAKRMSEVLGIPLCEQPTPPVPMNSLGHQSPRRAKD